MGFLAPILRTRHTTGHRIPVERRKTRDLTTWLFFRKGCNFKSINRQSNKHVLIFDVKVVRVCGYFVCTLFVECVFAVFCSVLLPPETIETMNVKRPAMHDDDARVKWESSFGRKTKHPSEEQTSSSSGKHDNGRSGSKIRQ